jgi:hypothetical protein
MVFGFSYMVISMIIFQDVGVPDDDDDDDDGQGHFIAASGAPKLRLSQV